ncbi:MAG TPA: dihydroneopterin aldolase [Sphingobacteriaceae bacterium]|nr:dihydroneopterin aldolase [Sphingobacteriaceae bacterium]
MAGTNRKGKLVQKITMDELRFFAYHGFYPEEQVTGNTFFVSVSISFPLAEFRKEEDQDDLNKTINYETVYDIINSEMSIARKLLETVCQCILQKIIDEFHYVEDVEVAIRKSSLPFGNEHVNASVFLKWSKENC